MRSGKSLIFILRMMGAMREARGREKSQVWHLKAPSGCLRMSAELGGSCCIAMGRAAVLWEEGR